MSEIDALNFRLLFVMIVLGKVYMPQHFIGLQFQSQRLLLDPLCNVIRRVLVFEYYYKSKFNNSYNPAGNYMFKVNNRNTRTRCKICSKLTIKTPERR